MGIEGMARKIAVDIAEPFSASLGVMATEMAKMTAELHEIVKLLRSIDSKLPTLRPQIAGSPSRIRTDPITPRRPR